MHSLHYSVIWCNRHQQENAERTENLVVYNRLPAQKSPDQAIPFYQSSRLLQKQCRNQGLGLPDLINGGNLGLI